MLKVKLTPEESVALHDQVAAELRRAIADGEADEENAYRRRETWRPS